MVGGGDLEVLDEYAVERPATARWLPLAAVVCPAVSSAATLLLSMALE